jgi:uncharacterized membrane protein (DUF2068 family)
VVPGSKRPEYRYELLTCAWHGHVLVGEHAAEVIPEDAVVVRESDGVRWCRCLRCDGWMSVPVPEHPSEERVPSRDQIEVPLRGPALRDRYVLRLIALDRVVHVVILTFLAIAFVTFATHNRALHADYQNIMNALNGGGAAATRVRGILGYLRKAFNYTPTHLFVLAAIFISYATLEGVEAIGLWFNKRWAEYLTFVATSLLIPYEIYELFLRLSVLKIVAFVLNVLVAAYLLYAKRLFGLRGGHAADEERKKALSGWPALEATFPIAEDARAG